MWLILRWLWTLVVVRSICDGLNLSAWLVLDTSCWQHRGSNCDGLDVVGNVITGVDDCVMTKGAADVVVGMAV